ncbi:MAG: protein DpdE [Polyangiaceae bacterium]
MPARHHINEANVFVVGDFVAVQAAPFGVGKLRAVHGSSAQVTWFDSPVLPVAHEEDFPLARLRRVELGNQHRVFHCDAETGAWHVGRVDDAGRIPGHHFGVDGDLYLIAFPNGDKRHVAIAQLETRWDRAIDDPASMLASRTTETPFWHEGRSLLMRSAMAQRAACGGLTGLFSSSIDLQAHQVRVVRTVLNDPIPRYLLADEVGLGKTIEALAILRQLVIEHPDDHDTLIVAPPHIQDQWRQELISRFGLGSLLDSSVRILGLSDLRGHDTPRMMIVDEAHHAAAYANSSDPDEQRLYRTLAGLAHQSRSVLLLSATPVLRNEDGFLAMLHLLDPAAYALDDKESFRYRIAQRQQVADWLSDLHDDAAPFFMEEALQGVIEKLASDKRLVGLAQAALPLINDDKNNERRAEALAKIRAYIGEVYRLHRRLLRTRRRTLEEPLWGRSGAKVIRCEDQTRAEADHLLLEWQAEVALAVFREEAPQQTALSLWRAFLEATLSHPAALQELVSARLHRRHPNPHLASCPAEALHAPMLFESEYARLQELAELLDGYESARDKALANHLLVHSEDRFVVFVDRKAVAERLQITLAGLLGETTRLHKGHEDVLAFARANSIRVLVCDGTAEEGLNLHLSPATIVHYDLPLAPNRIEQRLGRLDRIGAKRSVTSIVFEDDAPLPAAWLDVLSRAIGVFNDSIASLQYVLDSHLQILIEGSLNRGLEAFQDLTKAFLDEQTGLAAELKRIDRQESLDALEADPRERERFAEMEECDLNDEQLQVDLESWLVGRLLFHCQHVDSLGWLRRYAYQPKGQRPTLIPLQHWVKWFKGMIAGAQDASTYFIATPKVTYSRRQAHLQLVPLVRIGHPLFDGAVEHAKRDDRGVAFAMWRWRPYWRHEDPSIALRFDFLVDANAEQIRAELKGGDEVSVHSLQRRLDAVLPPQFVTIWLDDELREISDPETRAVLAEPYVKGTAQGGRDWNLVGERWTTVDKFFPAANWRPLIEAATTRARQTALASHGFFEEVGRARRELARRTAQVTAQLEARLVRLEGAARDAEQANLERELLISASMDVALEHPRVRPDSAGVVLLAGFGLSP